MRTPAPFDMSVFEPPLDKISSGAGLAAARRYYDDQAQSLLELRKLYFRLEKKFYARAIDQGFFIKILYAEALRRIQSKHCQDKQIFFEEAQFKQQFLEFAVLIQRSIPATFYISEPVTTDLELIYFGLYEIYAELQKKAKLLDEFDERVLAYFYQFSCRELRQQALKKVQSADKKNSTQEIISFTQLYTPAWVADYLCARSLYSQWQGSSSSASSQDLFFRFERFLSNEQERGARLSASELNFLDPACGAGNMLISAFDLFFGFYIHEAYSAKTAVESIVSKNLFATDLDKNALFVSAFSIVLKSFLESGCNQELSLELNLHDAAAAKKHGEIETGSLGRSFGSGHPLARTYQAVVTNPPYIGRRLLDRRLKQFLKENYPAAQHDLSAAFLVRALELCAPCGKVGFITQASLLYLPSYGALRKNFIDGGLVESVVELGTRVFPLSSGEKINSMLIVLQKQLPETSELAVRENRSVSYLNLSRTAAKASELSEKRNGFDKRNCRDFLLNREFAFNFNCPILLSSIFSSATKLSEIAQVKQGLATSDNERFLRYHWDVRQSELGRRWRPYVKGAGAQRWHAPLRTVVDWGENGEKIKTAVIANYPYLNGKTAWVVKNEQFYFRSGLTFSFVSTEAFAVRKLPEGAIFDVGGSALFALDQDLELLLLAYLNSSFAAVCVDLLNPTFNSQVGDVKEIPLPAFSEKQKSQLKDLAEEACMLKSFLDSFDESGLNFDDSRELVEVVLSANPEINRVWHSLKSSLQNAIARLKEIDCELDSIILSSIGKSYSCSKDELALIEKLISKKRQQRKPEPSSLESASDFAEMLLRAFIRKNIEDKTVLADFEEDLLKKISMPLKNWLEQVIDSGLNDYMLSRFNKAQESVFLASPRYIALALPGQSGSTILSSAGLRIEEDEPGKKSRKSGSGYKIVEAVGQKVRQINDWTGRDLARICNELSFYPEN